MVMGIFGNKCPSCSSPVARDASFCGNCGKALGTGRKTCGVCGAQNHADARFCGECGRPMTESAAPEIQNRRWARQSGDFAARVEAEDLPGILNKGLVVEPGTNALLVVSGENRGVVPPGSYKVENALQKGWDVLRGEVPQSATVLLADITPSELDFHLGGRFTKDPLPVGLTVRVVVEVGEPGRFLVNLLKGRERLSQNDLREYYYPEVYQVADRWLREHSLAELAETPSLRDALELTLEQTLKKSFGQAGLRFLQARTVELNLEPYDKIKGVRGKYALLDMEASTELEGRRRLAATEDDRRRYDEETRLSLAKEESDLKRRWEELKRSEDLRVLAAEVVKVQDEEGRIGLYQRLRQAALTDKINDLRTQGDFDRFLEETDLDKRMRAKDRDDLIKGWRQAGEDQDRLRAFLLAKTEVEQNFSLRGMQLTFQHGEDLQKLNNELEIARLRADQEFSLRLRTVEEEIKLETRRQEIERSRAQIEEERSRRQVELTRLQRDYDLETQRKTRTQSREEDEADALLGMRLMREMKETKRKDEEDTLRIQRLDEEERLRYRRVDELERRKLDQQLLIERTELDERRRQAEREFILKDKASGQDFELRRLAQLGQFGPEALIAVSGAEQGRILADLKKSEALKGMSEEQILAMAAERSPEVARAFQEKYRAIADGKISQEVKELYERLMREKDESLRREQADAERRSLDADKRVQDVSNAWGKAKDSTDRAIDRMADVAQTFAHTQPHQTPAAPIIITPAGGPPAVIFSPTGPAGPGTIPGGPGQGGELKICPECGKSVLAAVRYCPSCGHEFKGV